MCRPVHLKCDVIDRFGVLKKSAHRLNVFPLYKDPIGMECLKKCHDTLHNIKLLFRQRGESVFFTGSIYKRDWWFSLKHESLQMICFCC